MVTREAQSPRPAVFLSVIRVYLNDSEMLHTNPHPPSPLLPTGEGGSKEFEGEAPSNCPFLNCPFLIQRA